MAIGYGVAAPKGATRKQIKARLSRREAAIKRLVREDVQARDGYCRLAGVGLFCCDGPSEWAHLEDKRRARTRGMPPEVRHTVEDSVMLCHNHHCAYDGRHFVAEYLTAQGAEGDLYWHGSGMAYVEVRRVS